jgi:hypothetical protein
LVFFCFIDWFYEDLLCGRRKGIPMDFAGLPTGRLDNGHIQIDYLRSSALRLIRLHAFGSPNLFAELPELGWQTPYGFYRLLGGHRFWVAPESMDLTYLLEPPEILEEAIPDGVRLIQPIDLHSGLQKTIEVKLNPTQPEFALRHILLNAGAKPRHVAAWGITQFSLGGIAAFPQPSTTVDSGGYLPNRSLTLWPYTRLNDPRLRWMENYLMIRADRIHQPCKVGYAHPSGWGVYLHHGVLVIKKVNVQIEVHYPDMNSPIEMYIDHRFFELESLSPLTWIHPGEQIIHEEQFTLQKAENLTDEQSLAEYLDRMQESS